ncbi:TRANSMEMBRANE PROTEIN [Salix purpurea]|uniref:TRANSMEMBRANE PROTEIN n=1 Tax=Salix purpurea TaxID=77065 RepID=A0A9Q0YVR6_SALPP|nr:TRANSMEMBRANE PROTEIN [Salix purpurea]
MAGGSLKSILASLFIFAIVLSPVLPSADAGRLNHRGLGRVSRPPICPACVCCSPPPPGSCCSCCASPVQTQSTAGSP